MTQKAARQKFKNVGGCFCFLISQVPSHLWTGSQLLPMASEALPIACLIPCHCLLPTVGQPHHTTCHLDTHHSWDNGSRCKPGQRGGVSVLLLLSPQVSWGRGQLLLYLLRHSYRWGKCKLRPATGGCYKCSPGIQGLLCVHLTHLGPPP